MAFLFEMKWVHLPEKYPEMSSCYLAMAGHLRVHLLLRWKFSQISERNLLWSLQARHIFFIWHPDLLQPLGVKIVWGPSLIQPLRKGSGSYVLNPLPDKCHQAPNACWQEADLKKQFSRKEISLMASCVISNGIEHVKRK